MPPPLLEIEDLHAQAASGGGHLRLKGISLGVERSLMEPDRVHLLQEERIVASGKPELTLQVRTDTYESCLL
jgi:hypothetical protein